MEEIIGGGVAFFDELCKYTAENRILRSSLYEWRIPVALLKKTIFLESIENINGEKWPSRIDIELSEIEEELLDVCTAFCDDEKKDVKIQGYYLEEIETENYPYMRRLFNYLYMLKDWSRKVEFLWVFILFPYIYKMQKRQIGLGVLWEKLKMKYPFAELEDWSVREDWRIEKNLRKWTMNLTEEAEKYMEKEWGLNIEDLQRYKVMDADEQVVEDFIDGFKLVRDYRRKYEKQV